MKGKRLLLIEDNEKILRGNQRLLEWEGYEVDAARTLEQAEQCFVARRPDAVILDIMLPDGNGLEYMKALRQGRRCADLTAHRAHQPGRCNTGIGSRRR